MDITQLQKEFPMLDFREHVTVAPYTYMKVGGPAKVFVEVTEKSDLFHLCAYCFTENIPFVVIGGASNIIVSDEGIDKLVIRNLTHAISYNLQATSYKLVTADSGVITAILAKKSADAGLTGLEYFVGVPGTIGGAIYNNSHFTAHELIGNYVESVEVCTTTGELQVWTREKLDLSYDHSVFHHCSDVILSATFSLQQGNKEEIQERIREYAKKRAYTQPIGLPSSGCMWRNVKVNSEQVAVISTQIEIPGGALKHVEDGSVQIAAGFLIDTAGLKGTRVGGAEVSEKHATFLVNTGTATASDIDALATLVEQKVFERFGIHLEREVFFIK